MTGQTSQLPTQPPVLAEQGLDIGALTFQIAQRRVQLAGLRAQWTSLQSQLHAMLPNNPARPGIQGQWADVGVQIASAEGDIARLQAQVQLKQGTPIGAPGRPVNPGWPTPQMVVPVTAIMAVMILPMSIAWARRILRGRPAPAAVPYDYTMRLDRIEQAVDAIAIEVERVSEGQRFVTKVLAERRTQDAPAESAPATENRPLALGAGPLEPIVVSQRERVAQRIVTPH
jgi:hypothetical protein